MRQLKLYICISGLMNIIAVVVQAQKKNSTTAGRPKDSTKNDLQNSLYNRVRCTLFLIIRMFK